MVGRDAKLLDGLTVFLRGVAFIRTPVVLGVFLCQLVHVVVTIGLGEDARCCDGEVLAIALDDGRVG